jgi:hypothetical protein
MVAHNTQVEWGIQAFFGWFRRRHANVAALAQTVPPERANARAGSFVPDQHVLIGSGIEALANAWARLFRPDLDEVPPAGRRWSAFLAENANASGIFNLVAAPLLADELQSDAEQATARARLQGNPKAAADAAEATKLTMAAVVVRRLARDTDGHRGGVVRFADEDPDYDVLVAHPDIVALQLGPKGRYLERFRYGEVLYSEHRCPWVHTLAASEKLAASDHDEYTGWNAESSVRVRYVNWGLRPSAIEPSRLVAAQRRPLFTVQWLLGIYGSCIDCFERRCVDEHRNPMP